MVGLKSNNVSKWGPRRIPKVATDTSSLFQSLMPRGNWPSHGIILTNFHYGDVVMGTVASQITCLTIVYSTIYSGVDKRKHQSSASLAFLWGIHSGPVNSPHKWPVTRKMFPLDDVIILRCNVSSPGCDELKCFDIPQCHYRGENNVRANSVGCK